jgi:hypothetical protein
VIVLFLYFCCCHLIIHAAFLMRDKDYYYYYYIFIYIHMNEFIIHYHQHAYQLCRSTTMYAKHKAENKIAKQKHYSSCQ